MTASIQATVESLHRLAHTQESAAHRAELGVTATIQMQMGTTKEGAGCPRCGQRLSALTR